MFTNSLPYFVHFQRLAPPAVILAEGRNPVEYAVRTCQLVNNAIQACHRISEHKQE